MDPDTDVCQTEQPQISYSVDFTAEQSSAMGSPILLDREGTQYIIHKVNPEDTAVATVPYSSAAADKDTRRTSSVENRKLA